MLRVGILGYGYMGTIRFAALEERADCVVSRIFHIGADAPVTGPATWEEVADDPDVDCIFVCLPNDLTCDAVCRALAAGKHVFAEKPPGISVAEVRRMMAAEEASGRTLKFGFNHRVHPAVLAAKERVAALGDIVWVRGRYGKSGEVTGWRADPARSGGGILIDQGIHMLDLMLMLCGDFDEVEAFSLGDVEHDLVAILRNDRQLATLHSSNTQWQPLFSLEISLTGGLVWVHGLLSRTGRYGPEQLDWRTIDDPEMHVERFEIDDSWGTEIEAFFAAVRDGTPVQVGSARDALRLMTLIERIYAAARRSRGLH